MEKKSDLLLLDRPEILNFLFYPRKETGDSLPDYAKNFDIITQDGILIGSRMYLTDPDKPHILFFHGNGEIAEDYDEIGAVFTRYGMNFIVVDYRGYGRSEGAPGVASMITDAHQALTDICKWLKEENRNGPLWIMGRTLGSASAIELASNYPDKIKGLIIESGFAHTIALLQRIGVNTKLLNLTDEHIISNLQKIKKYSGPTVIIHGEFDQVIPVNHGKDLFENSPASFKKIHVIEGADHNTLLMVSGQKYFEMIHDFIDQAMAC